MFADGDAEAHAVVGRSILTRMTLAGSIVMATVIALPVTAAAGSRLIDQTTRKGVTVRINVPAGPWRHGELIRGTVKVTNTNDRTAWYHDIDCGDVAALVRVPTDPDQGQVFGGDLAAFKRLALSARPDVGPVVGRFRIAGTGDCAEPHPESLAPGASRTYAISWRVEDVVRGVYALDVSAAFQFEGFKRSKVSWQDRAPRPITASVRVPVPPRKVSLMSPVTAIDRALNRNDVREEIRATDRDGWTDVEMELVHRADGRWQWRMVLSGSYEPGSNPTGLMSFEINAAR